MNLEDLLCTETDRIEWKRSPQDSDGLFHAVCALANDLGSSVCPGYLVVGIEKDGTPGGIDRMRLDQIQQDIANRLRSTKIQPTPSFDVNVADAGADISLLVVTVHPYPMPPVVTVEGIAWVRQGSRTRRATEADWQRLRERRPDRSQPFDLRSIGDAGLVDLDTRRLRDIYDATRFGDLDEETFPPFEQWYADRIELSNPGAPYGRASEGELGEHTDYRNPIVTAGLVELGYVEQLGRGIRRVRLQLERNGNPPLVAEVDGFTRVVVRGRP